MATATQSEIESAIMSEAMATDTRALTTREFISAYPGQPWRNRDQANYHLQRRRTNGLLATGAVVELRSAPEQERCSLRIIPSKMHNYLNGHRIAELGDGDQFLAAQLQEAVDRMISLEARLVAVTRVLEARA